MRWTEITETDIAAKAAAQARKTIRARERIANAQRRKAEAGRRYQEALRTANAAQNAATRDLSAPST